MTSFVDDSNIQIKFPLLQYRVVTLNKAAVNRNVMSFKKTILIRNSFHDVFQFMRKLSEVLFKIFLETS